MRRLTILISIIALLASSCQNRRPNKSLAEVDSLVVAELYDSAYHLVETMDESNFYTPEDLAHFNLLRVQTAYLVNKPLAYSDSILDKLIVFYEEHPDNEKRIDAYYYRAIGTNAQQDYQKSIILYKKAEKLAEITGNKRLQFKIAEGITYVNGMCFNFDLQLSYAKKSLQLAQELDKKDLIAYSFYRVAYAYSKKGNKDSAYYYSSLILPYIDFISKKERPVLLSSLGFLFRFNNPKQAKEYLLQSLSYQELTATYMYLAEISYNEGKPEDAYHYWKKGLRVQDATPKDNIIHNIIEYDMERGKIDSICERINEIIAIRDSIDAKLKNDTIKDLQTRFDHEVAMREKDQTIIRWQWGILAAILVIVGLAAYSIIKRYRSSMVLKNYQMQIIDYTNQIREMELASEDYSKQIETLSQEVRQIMDEKSPRLSEGRMLYDCIMESKPIVKWSADDEKKFIEYFTATNYRLISHLRKEPRRENLTDHKLIYLLLKEMGKTDKEVCDIMGLSDAGLRSIRNRTKPLKEPAG